MKKEQEDVCALALSTFGIVAQRRMLFEEMAELQNAICKSYRGRATDEDIVTEIADVMIMCEQMAQHYGKEAVEREVERKIERLADRIIERISRRQKTNKKMELDEYQNRAMTTCMESCANFPYMFLNLVGEVGEFASKVAKAIRREQIEVGKTPWLTTTDKSDPYDNPEIGSRFISEFDNELRKEAGDILWQLSCLCAIGGWSLEAIARQNLDKLASRKNRGVIDGDGDNR